MRIRVWHAFASNNSGSYTIVGSFPTAELAAEVAAELTELVAAHTAWLESGAEDAPPAGTSPMQAFVERHGLHWEEGLGAGDDWPRYGKVNVPGVAAAGRQVVLHHPYTVTLPRTFGELFYRRGGRVETEIDHGHHPIVAVFELWIPWDQPRVGRDPKVAREERLFAALCDPDGPVAAQLVDDSEPVRPPREPGESLRVGMRFVDLADGFAAVNAVARAHEFDLRVRVMEAWLEEGDPLAFLRG